MAVSEPEAIAHPTPVLPDRTRSDQPMKPTRPTDALPTYSVSEGSLIIHIGRAGRLARLGHNHLVASTALVGTARLTPEGSLDAQLSVEVHTLSVDDPTLRERYRQRSTPEQNWEEIYASRPTPKNIADTRKNMLGERVLDAQTYPSISARALAPGVAELAWQEGAAESNAEVHISLRDKTVSQPVVVRWERRPNGHIYWQTSFRLTHAQLGLRPFSALGGALSVADALMLEISGTLVADSAH